MPDSLENFILYVPRTTFRVEQIAEILSSLWQRGMSLSATRAHDEAQMRWDTLLDMPIFAPPDPRADAPELNQTPRQQLNTIIQLGEGTIHLFDYGLEYSLSVITERAERNHLQADPDFVKLYFNPSHSYDNTEIVAFPEGQQVLHAFQIVPLHQAWLAYMHWCQVLCEVVKPLYGFGVGGWLKEERESSFFTLSMRVADELRQHRVPAEYREIESGGIRYISPALLQTDVLLAMMSRPGWTLTCLATKGVFVLPPIRPFKYEYNAHFRLRREANLILADVIQRQRAGGLSAAEEQRLRQEIAMKTQRADEIISFDR